MIRLGMYKYKVLRKGNQSPCTTVCACEQICLSRNSGRYRNCQATL